MKILITGAKGMLAQAVCEKFKQGNELILTDSAELDITDLEAVMTAMNEYQPELVINCAAYTNVDGAETNEGVAFKVNATGPENLAKGAEKVGATLVHVSTDYVFGGAKDISEEYLEDDAKAPETAYGRTKLAGEEEIVDNCSKYYIFRTAWLYGLGGKNFVKTMLGAGKTNPEVTVVNDQHGSPTYTEDLTEIIYEAVTKKIPYGIYNSTNLGNTTWAEFTEEIYRQAGVDCKVTGISSEEYEKKAEEKAKAEGIERKVAPRPKNSQMSKQKLIDAGVTVRPWQEALADYLKKEEL